MESREYKLLQEEEKAKLRNHAIIRLTDILDTELSELTDILERIRNTAKMLQCEGLVEDIIKDTI